MGNFNKKTLDKWTANELDRQQKRKETMGNFNKKTLDKWTANELDRQQKRKETGEPVKPWEYKTCSHCYSSIHPAFRICPYCYEVLK